MLFERPSLRGADLLGSLPSAEELWDDLLRRGTRLPAFRVVREGTGVAASAVTRRAGIGNRAVTDLVSANRVVDRYRRGDTVVLQGLHQTHPHLAKVANNLALALDHPVQVNAYLSPASARGLDLHFDFHDVFIVQLDGCKRWRVWPPLGRTTNPVRGRHVIAGPRPDELGDPLLDVTLAPGDCLYVPRGFPHLAETVDERSDHLTVGLVAVTWDRVLRKAIEAETAAGRLTAPLPAGLLEPGAPMPAAPAAPESLGQLMPASTLRHWLAREIWRRQPATRLRPRAVPALPPSAELAFTPGPLLWLTTTGDRAVLGLGDRLLDMPGEAFDFLSELLEAEPPVGIDELKGLDHDSRDVVLRRLLAEGVLAHAA